MVGVNGCLALKNTATDAKNATMALQTEFMASKTAFMAQSKTAPGTITRTRPLLNRRLSRWDS